MFTPVLPLAQLHARRLAEVRLHPDNSRHGPEEERPLDEAATAAGMVRDTIAIIGHDRTGVDKPDHKIRIVVIKPHPIAAAGFIAGMSPTAKHAAHRTI